MNAKRYSTGGSGGGRRRAEEVSEGLGSLGKYDKDKSLMSPKAVWGYGDYATNVNLNFW